MHLVRRISKDRHNTLQHVRGTFNRHSTKRFPKHQRNILIQQHIIHLNNDGEEGEDSIPPLELVGEFSFNRELPNINELPPPAPLNRQRRIYSTSDFLLNILPSIFNNLNELDEESDIEELD